MTTRPDPTKSCAMGRPGFKLAISWVVAVFLFAKMAMPNQGINIVGNHHISYKSILGLLGKEEQAKTDSSEVQRLVSTLWHTGLFDTVYAAFDDSLGKSWRIIVKESHRRIPLAPGGAIEFSLFSQDHFWFHLSPGYRERFLFNRPHELTVRVSLPYWYSASAAWQCHGFPRPGFTSSITVSGNAYPYSFAPFYAQKLKVSGSLKKKLKNKLSISFGLAHEQLKTWAIDLQEWENKGSPSLRFQPDNFIDVSRSTHYPKTERAIPFGLSIEKNGLNRIHDPTNGGFISAGLRHWEIATLGSSYRYSFNQVSLKSRHYLKQNKNRIFVIKFESIIRDRFDLDNLEHRLIYHNDDSHFRGFNLLCGENIAFSNMEFRLRMMRINKEHYQTVLRGKAPKIVDRLFCGIDALAFADNGLLWGNSFNGSWRNIQPGIKRIGDDLYTSLGIGARIVFPSIKQIVSAGVMLYHRKLDLNDEYKQRFYATLSAKY